MSLVQKFENGGKRTIKRGNDLIDLDVYIRNLEHNFQRWADSKNFNKKERQAVEEAYRDMINEYDKGNLNPILGGGAEHSLGRIKNSPEGFDAYGVAHRFFTDVLNRLSVISPKETSSGKLKFDRKTGLDSFLKRELFNGRDFDPSFILLDNDYNEETGSRSITKRAQRLNEVLDKLNDPTNIYDFDSDEDKVYLLNLISKVRSHMASDGKITEDEYLDLSNAGIDPNKYFFTGKDFNTELKKEEELVTDNERRIKEAQEEERQYQLKQQADSYDRLKEYRALPTRDDLRVQFSDYNPLDTSKINFNEESRAILTNWEQNAVTQLDKYLKNHNLYDLAKDPKFLNSKDESFFRKLGINTTPKITENGETKYLVDHKNWTNGQKLAYLFDLYEKYYPELKNESIPTLSDNQRIMSYDNGYARLYDPNTRTMYHKRIADIPELLRVEFADLIPSNKEGGILEAKDGLKYRPIKTSDQIRAEFAERRKELEEELKKEELKNKATKSNRTVEQLKAADRVPSETEFSNIDKMRLTSIGIDVASMLSSFVPGYGTAASGVLGLGSTALNATADFSDESVSTLDAFKNMGIGLGLDLYGLIPGVGASGKIAKMTKTLVKYVPKILPMLAVFDVPDIAKSFSKIGSDEKLTVEDWRNISEGIGLITGTVRAGAVKAKKQTIKSAANLTQSGNTYKVKTSDGTSFDLTKEQFDLLNQTRSLKEANDIFLGFKLKGSKDKSLIGSRSRVTPWKSDSLMFRRSGLTQTEGDTTFDLSNISRFGFTSSKNGRFGRWSDVGLVDAELNPQTTLNFPSFYSVSTFPAPKPKRKPKSKLLSKPKSKPKQQPKPQVSTGSGPGGALWTKPGRATTNKNGGILERINKLKQGGSIRKLDKGGAADWYFDRTTNNAVVNDNINSFYNLGGWTNTLRKDLAGNYIIDNGHSNAGNLVEAYNRNQAYTSNKDLISQDLQSYYGTLGNNLSAEDFVKQYNTAADRIRNFFHNGVNHSESEDKNVRAHNILFKQLFNNRSLENNLGLNYNLGWLNNLLGRLGSTTFMRRMDTYENEFDLNTPDQNRIHTITEPDGKTFLVYKKANGDIGIWNPTDNSLGDTDEPYDGSDFIENEEQTPPDPSKLVDKDSPDKKNNQHIQSLFMKLGPDVIGAGRLYGTLRTNRSIYDTMRKSIKPLLLNTYELYSPITGAYGEMALANRQAAQTLDAAYRPYTTDASLNAARMLEGQKQANDLQLRGFLADDKEIKRTAEQALARQEDNIKRRSDLANTNRASIHDANQKLALLRADYKLKNWNAINTFLSGKEVDAKQNWQDYRSYAMDLINKQNTLDQQAELSAMGDDYWNWKNQPDNQNKTMREWPGYSEYIAKQREIQRKQLELLGQFGRQFYGFPITLGNTYHYENQA